jgi:hypothetical protein
MKTQCPHCKVKFNTNDANAGRQAKCPKCAKPFTIQPIAEAPAQPAQAQPSPKPAPAAVTPPRAPQQVQTPPPATPPKTPEPMQAPPPLAQPPQKPVEPPARSAVTPKPPQPQAPAQKPQQAPAPAAQQAPPPRAAEPIKEKRAPKALPKKTLSKLLYVYGWLAACVITGILAAAGLMFDLGDAANSTVFAAFAAADLFLLISVAVEMLLFYKMWDAIPTAQASISPGKAVGFLFIPGFNIYWALLMLTAFAEDCAIFLVIPLLCTLVIPHFVNRVFSNLGDLAWPVVGLAVAIGLAHLVTYLLTASRTCTAVNALQGE